MDTKARILKILSENANRSVSGETMAEELGVSRNAVCKAVAALKKEGWNIQSATNRGYMLSPADLIDKDLVQKLLGGEFNLIYNEQLPSTNSLAKELAAKGAAEGTVVLASFQTEGRGRMGRNFVSPKDCGIYLSVILRPEFSPEKSLLITSAAAVAAANAIEAECGIEAGIKWVNDIYCRGKKVCGILTEAAMNMEMGRLDYAVLGVGINVYEPNGGYPEEIKNIAGAVCGGEVRFGLRNRLAARVVSEFFKIYKSDKLADFMDQYRSRSVVIGKKITVYCGNESYEAVAEDIEDNGGLVVADLDGKRHTLQSGEITIRGDFGE